MLDTLLVPGAVDAGPGGSVARVDGDVVAWVARVTPLARRVVSVCVGAHLIMTSLIGEVLATTQQQLFPEEILARVSSLDWMISLIAMPAGYAAAAPVAQFLGMRTTLLAAAALIGTPCLLLNLLPGVRSVQRFPDGTVGIASERDTAAPLRHSGTGATLRKRRIRHIST
ncbi:MAG TPA: hypothetical protein VGD53_28990 [Actinoallomurus sp.]